VRLEVKSLSKHELSLQQHMESYRQIACQQTIKEGCSYNPVVANLPEFDPAAYAAAAPEGPQGCAKIEAQAIDGGPKIGDKTSETLPERFFFARSVSEADGTMLATALSVAQRLGADPSIECVGVVGQSAAGESPGLGELRAQTVKRLLVQQGVPTYRMMTISASTPLYGAGSEQQPAKPEDQRVSITVILRTNQPSAVPPGPTPAPGSTPAQ
jgi:outer membrane protein OmpA-like peptidoglycan-associated protein